MEKELTFELSIFYQLFYYNFMYMIYKFFVVPDTNYNSSNNNHMDLFEQK